MSSVEYLLSGRSPSLTAKLTMSRDEQASQGAAIVLRTLTGGARAIFRLLAQHQLAGDADDEAGESFADCQ